jgi:hypothetical protein
MESENIVLQETPVSTDAAVSTDAPAAPAVDVPPEVRLLQVEVTDQNIALNVIVSFLSVAQKRGVFGLQESAKIWECIKMFEIPPK